MPPIDMTPDPGCASTNNATDPSEPFTLRHHTRPTYTEAQEEIISTVRSDERLESSVDDLNSEVETDCQSEEDQSCWFEFDKTESFGTSEKIKFDSDVTRREAHLMILNYYVRHHLTQGALVDLLRMLNVMAGYKFFPESFETFAANFPDRYESARVYYCVECQSGVGDSAPNENFICSIPNCGSKKIDFFMTIPIEQQLRETILKYEKEICDYEETVKVEAVSDISQGKIVKEISSTIPEKLITLSVNTDGAAAYRWSINKPCYPIFLTINNLPPRIRFDKNNLLLAAVWLSKGEPSIPLFFKNFCEEINQLGEGIAIGTDKYKVVVVQNCLDSVARPKLQNSTQFNGKFGCSLCLHEGKVVLGNQVRYPFRKAPSRNHTETRRHMIEAHTTGNPINGIKGLSVFLSVPHFDIVKGNI
ncbi:uncharacterized protein LOC134288375 isoform X2 [Aedes albopictus]|uniref:Uncharacterized protein n=1 Tax=Aedes albopictus TaxID=7160 RepID=A0ABM1XRR7_AEDAL